MPKMAAKKQKLAQLKTRLGIKHACALALLDHPDAGERETLEQYLAEYVDINTYREAVDYLRQEQAAPTYHSEVCPECGADETYGECSCYSGFDPNACPECGAGGSGDPYGECCCYEDDEDEAA